MLRLCLLCLTPLTPRQPHDIVDLISNSEFLSTGSKMSLIDDLAWPKISTSLGTKPETHFLSHQENEHPGTHITRGAGTSPLQELHDVRVDNFTSPYKPCRHTKDPLNHDKYFTAHRRMERREKQIRNIEKERAQHEKMQLDRLLNALQGHDWLRVMGVTGITEMERRLYEPKRTYFIMEVSALLQKFKMWKREEKRRKVENSQFASSWISKSTENSGMDADDQDAGPSALYGRQDAVSPFQSLNEHSESTGLKTDDIDAWAARQLHQEAMSALPENSQKAAFKPQPFRDRPLRTSGTCNDSFTLESNSTALGRAGRKPLESTATKNSREVSNQAFGHSIPIFSRSTFQLSPCILTKEAIRDCRRRKRRRRRDQKQ